MKEVKLIFRSGMMEIHADGPKGKGTESFTMDLGQSVGDIVERHRGHHHAHVHVDATQVQVNVNG